MVFLSVPSSLILISFDLRVVLKREISPSSTYKPPPSLALFFSIIELPNIDGCVWAYELSFWSEKLENLDKIDSLNPYYPDQINERLIAQEGCFTLHPFPKENVPLIPIENIKFHHKSIRSLVKIIIPYIMKKDIGYDLTRFGINYRSLFPDLDGLAKQINWELPFYF